MELLYSVLYDIALAIIMPANVIKSDEYINNNGETAHDVWREIIDIIFCTAGSNLLELDELSYVDILWKGGAYSYYSLI